MLKASGNRYVGILNQYTYSGECGHSLNGVLKKNVKKKFSVSEHMALCHEKIGFELLLSVR